MTIATPNPHHTTGHRPWEKWHLIGKRPVSTAFLSYR